MLIRPHQRRESKPMKPIHFVLVLSLLLIGVATAAFAPVPGDTVNSTCPISGQAVDGTTTVEHAGKKIGVCCAKCQAAVAAWSAEQKDTYLAKVSAQAAPQQVEALAYAEPYLLTTCPIAGGPVGDKPTAVTLEGRTIQVCCAKCKAAAEADPAGTLAKVDTMIAEQQRALYPLTHCVVMADESLVAEDGADTAKEVVVGNRLFRVCCPGCIKKVKKDPAKFAALLDEAALKAQQASYPLAHCVVNPKQVFGADAPAHEFMVAGRLVRTCCKSCEAKVRAEPLKYVGMVDAARSRAQK
jgi:hypothetical protein